jgi:hypothetical protein
VDYLQKQEARWAVKIKGTVGRKMKRNLPTPCSSCSGRKKKTTKTIQDILSGSKKKAWKNRDHGCSKKNIREMMIKKNKGRGR